MKNLKKLKELRSNSLAILTFALSGISNLSAKEFKPSNCYNSDLDTNTNKNFLKPSLKPKLVLKLNMKNPEDGHLLSMHRSHSSHRSIAQHIAFDLPTSFILSINRL